MMNSFPANNNAQILRELMTQAGVSSLKELSQVSGVSQGELRRIEEGLLPKISVESVVKLANALGISVNQLLAAFLPESLFPITLKQYKDNKEQIEVYKAEYQRLLDKMSNLDQILRQKWQNSALDILESWLIYWPTAVAAVRQNSDLPATKIISLVKPVEKLLESWGIQAIGTVGERVAYNEEIHELMEGTAQQGEMVVVRNVGYKNNENLLIKVKVSN